MQTLMKSTCSKKSTQNGCINKKKIISKLLNQKQRSETLNLACVRLFLKSLFQMEKMTSGVLQYLAAYLNHSRNT